jgi:tetratricopeptide (TPR) repeat protein
MSPQIPSSTPEADPKPDGELLHSWKEIATYLRRTVRTVHRWEKEEGLPVRRHPHKKLGSVYAFKSELDAWWADGHQRQARKLGRPTGPRLSTGGAASANSEANEYFEKALLALKAQYDLPRGQQLFERALKFDPNFAEARAWLGFTYLMRLKMGESNDSGLLYKADEELRRALHDDPICARAYSVLGGVYLLQGRKEAARFQLERSRVIQPTEIDAPLWLGLYYMLNGEFEAGIPLAKEQLDRDPTLWPARKVLGTLLMLNGDRPGAMRELEKILDQDSQNHFGLRTLAWVHLHARELALAREALERLRALAPANYQTRMLRALLLALEGCRSEAMQEADDDVLKYAAAVVWDTVEVAALYSVLGETEKALEWLDRAVRLGDERADWFCRDPLLAAVRDHPRFQQILDSVAFRRQQRARS